MAKELSGEGRRILILDKGSEKEPPQKNLMGRVIAKYHDGLLMHSIGRKLKSLAGIDRTVPIHYRTGFGGTTTITACNATRSLEKELGTFGIDISNEFQELEQELKIAAFPLERMGKGTQKLCEAGNLLGLTMEPMPKCIDFSRCGNCTRCRPECPNNAKWTALSFIKIAQDNSTSVMKNIEVNEILTSNGRAVGVKATGTSGEVHIRANIVVLSAGAILSPVILQKSGLENAGKKLFCDPYYIVCAPGKNDSYEWEHCSIVNLEFCYTDKFILTNGNVPQCSKTFFPKIFQPKTDGRLLLGIWIKLKDDTVGSISRDGRIEKALTQNDVQKLKKGVFIAAEILAKAGVEHQHIKLRGPGGHHPGGTAAIGEVVDRNLETEIKNLFVADASVLPKAPGLPPMLTIMALSKRLGKRLNRFI